MYLKFEIPSKETTNYRVVKQAFGLSILFILVVIKPMYFMTRYYLPIAKIYSRLKHFAKIKLRIICNYVDELSYV